MLTAATLGMTLYGVYSAGVGIWDLLVISRLEVLADVLLIVLGLVLVLASAFVRVRLPGGAELAAAAILALQGLALHNAAHTETGITVIPQLLRGLFAIALLTVAFSRGRPEPAGASGRPADRPDGHGQPHGHGQPRDHG